MSISKPVTGKQNIGFMFDAVKLIVMIRTKGYPSKIRVFTEGVNAWVSNINAYYGSDYGTKVELGLGQH